MNFTCLIVFAGIHLSLFNYGGGYKILCLAGRHSFSMAGGVFFCTDAD